MRRCAPSAGGESARWVPERKRPGKTRAAMPDAQPTTPPAARIQPSPHIGEAALQRGDDRSRIVDAERRLRDVRDGRLGSQIQGIDVMLGLHQQYRSRYLAHRPLDLRMAGVADQDDNATLRDIPLALAVD